MEPLYEQQFLECSYGFRPKRSAHQAIEELWQVLMAMGGGWVYEVDIRKFFDTVKPEHIRTMLSKRVGDGVIRRTIGKWLKAGVWEDGAIHYPEEGTPQGGVISPMLSNIYLHEVLDAWFEYEVKPLLRGKARLIRFADDYVIAFECKDDAERVETVTPRRFARFGLTINEQKTRIVDFRRPVTRREAPGVFDFLGFTHYWGKSRRGAWVVKGQTAAKKLRKAVGKVYRKCKRDRHKPVKQQWESLCRTVRGHYGFYGITFNIEGLQRYFEAVKRAWQKWLNRRSRDKDMPWVRFRNLLDRYPLPSPRIVHSYV